MNVLLIASRTGPGAERLVRALSTGAASVRVCERAAEGEHEAGHGVSVVVADVHVVDDEFFLRLRTRHGSVPALAWVAVASSSAVATVLDGGADDVLDATMSDVELAARVRAAARRASPESRAATVAALHVDPLRGEATWQDYRLPLTPRELAVLHVLASAAGRTVRREAIYRSVWGFTMARGDRTVDVNVKRLRDKLAAAAAGVEIATQPGAGYRLDVTASAVTAS